MSKAKLRKLLGQAPFLNPFYDSSDPALWDREINIVLKIADGKRLVGGRVWHDEHAEYCVYWYWETGLPYPAEYDTPVQLLVSRGIIREVWCAGGASHMILTDAAMAAVKQANGAGRKKASVQHV